MRIRTELSNHAGRRHVALIGAAVAACFAVGVAQAAPMQSQDPGWQSPAEQATQQGGPGWAENASQAQIEHDYAQLPNPDQGGRDWRPITAAPAEQGGPGRSAPDALVDDSTQVATPAPAPGANALTPDRALLTATIEFPPYGIRLSGDVPAALNALAATAGQLPGPVVITARADPIEQHVQAADISAARAQSVADYLAQQGLDPQRIVVRAVGVTQPRVDPLACAGRFGSALAVCLAPDRSVTVQVGQRQVGMLETPAAVAD